MDADGNAPSRVRKFDLTAISTRLQHGRLDVRPPFPRQTAWHLTGAGNECMPAPPFRCVCSTSPRLAQLRRCFIALTLRAIGSRELRSAASRPAAGQPFSTSVVRPLELVGSLPDVQSRTHARERAGERDRTTNSQACWRAGGPSPFMGRPFPMKSRPRLEDGI
ncbi:hypothetical protein LY76DRAFT_64412 [Colletotrichum caudatum]|nr:hypothetical protein LY76DRAFT_64412 [Colletotrichum caudatum]